jgi:group II intron reverse transcriptase/maturase
MGHLLDRILDFENMTEAWEETRKAGETPGVDHVSVRRFQRHWETHLWDIIADVRANAYRPWPLRIITIPKRSGGKRRLGVPTLTDRVLQRAVLQMLGPRLDRKFLSCSYGYRPKRSLFHAVAAILKYRDRKLTWVLDADIDSFFDSMDQPLLWTLIQKEVRDPGVLRLLQLWLEVGVVNAHQQKGVSQGMPISPLLSNLYLHEMDWQLVRNRWSLVRYADDFIVLTYSQAEAERCQGIVADILDDLMLEFQPEKTHVTSFDEGFEFLGVFFDKDSYTYTWQDKRVQVHGSQGPLWGMWDYFPHGYE